MLRHTRGLSESAQASSGVNCITKKHGYPECLAVCYLCNAMDGQLLHATESQVIALIWKMIALTYFFVAVDSLVVWSVVWTSHALLVSCQLFAVPLNTVFSCYHKAARRVSIQKSHALALFVSCSNLCIGETERTEHAFQKSSFWRMWSG